MRARDRGFKYWFLPLKGKKGSCISGLISLNMSKRSRVQIFVFQVEIILVNNGN